MDTKGDQSTAAIWLLNSTQEPSSDARTPVDLRLAKLCVYVMIFILSVTGNTLVILSVALFDKMKVVPNLFIANLAVCDLTTTLFSIPFDLVEAQLGFFPYGNVVCSALWPLATLSTTSAALTLVAISCDRYLKIIRPLDFNVHITRRGCLKIIALLHFASFAAILPYAAVLRYSEEPVPSCKEQWPHGAPFSKIYTFFLFVLQYAAPLLVMSVIYIRLGISLFKNTKDATKLGADQQSSRERSMSDTLCLKRKQQNDKITKMFLIVVVIFLVFMMPHQMLFLFYDYAESEVLTNHGDILNLISRAFTYTNAILNVVIYGVCNRSFRVTFKEIGKCQCSKAHQRERERSSTDFVPHTTRNAQDRKSRDDRRPDPSDINGLTQRDSKLAVFPRGNGIKIKTNKASKNAGKPDDFCEHSSRMASGNSTQASATLQESALWLFETELLLKRLCRENSWDGEVTDLGNMDINHADVRETIL